MFIEVTKTITIYEIIAMATAVLIPLLQMVYRRFFCVPKLSYIANEYATIYFNAGGPQVCICGVFEVENQNTIVRKVELELSDGGGKLLSSMDWAFVISPDIQQNVQNTVPVSNTQITSRIHPIKIQPEDIQNADLHFVDNHVEPEMQKMLRNLWFLAYEIHTRFPTDYIKAQTEFTQSPTFEEAKRYFEQCFFWKPGEYKISMLTKYRNKELICKYRFELNDYDCIRLKRAIDTLLMWHLQSMYGYMTGICEIISVKLYFLEKKTVRKK